eukprot:CAMPEP_0118910062 /NCGR_PEP_ID=MMETSP1166-20130328/12366_1 /TAXON_ID=1104430 /ORGANISM="Chrysoreinhardia sp, Strain CCMP3193" /LENGTH=319 /DNA_ID=CAMNT_0006849517 /DNA_START=1 /DNA_END=960 /DNA_ORIENTATION=+
MWELFALVLVLGSTTRAFLTSVPAASLAEFKERGFATIPQALMEDEVSELDGPFEYVMNGSLRDTMKRDFCDMSKSWDAPFETWSIINGMLPSRYHGALKETAYGRQAARIAAAIFGEDAMRFDYDQLLDKRPGKTDAVFAMHQDMVYWPPAELTANETATVTVTLYLDDADDANGCLRYVPGSNTAKTLRHHEPLLSGSRDEGHALVTKLFEEDVVSLAPAKRGDLTIHDEWVVHGSGGNRSPDRSRRTYVIAYRHKDIVQAERDAGFTHSHNDPFNWDSFRDGNKGGGETAPPSAPPPSAEGDERSVKTQHPLSREL